MFALGAQTTSFSPVSIGDQSGGWSDAGQHLGRAVNATMNHDQRQKAATEASTALSLERGKLENDLLRTQIASAQAQLTAARNPPMPNSSQSVSMIPGQGDAPRMAVTSGENAAQKNEPLEVPSVPVATPNREAGVSPEVGWNRTNTGWAPVRGKNATEALEDDWIGSGMWQMRNRLAPTLGFNGSPPFPAPPGKQWRYNGWLQEYQLIPRRNSASWRDFADPDMGRR